MYGNQENLRTSQMQYRCTAKHLQQINECLAIMNKEKRWSLTSKADLMHDLVSNAHMKLHIPEPMKKAVVKKKAIVKPKKVKK